MAHMRKFGSIFIFLIAFVLTSALVLNLSHHLLWFSDVKTKVVDYRDIYDFGQNHNSEIRIFKLEKKNEKNKRYSPSSEISSEVRIFEATRAWKWYMMLNWLRRQSAKKELSRSIIDSCRRIMLSQRWYLWYSSDQIIGYIRCQTWATVRVLRISVRLGNDSRQKLSKVSFEISQKLRKILPNPKSEIYKALESWFLRPFSGWRYCFHGHFGEIRDSLKRDNRHSD